MTPCFRRVGRGQGSVLYVLVFETMTRVSVVVDDDSASLILGSQLCIAVRGLCAGD